MPHAVIYIHGFNSSPLSLKAQQLQQYFVEHQLLEKAEYELHVPELDHQPKVAIAQLQLLIEKYEGQSVLVIGSSLGGYYSLWLAAQYEQVSAVLINPAVYPYRLLSDLLGENQNLYTGKRYILDGTHIEQLKVLDVEHLSHPCRVLLLSQTGDETLDYREAVDKYPSIEQRVSEGGDHGYVNFEQELPGIFKFYEQQLKK
jgi:predicted esterase YcpF (UPF0227 family)